MFVSSTLQLQSSGLRFSWLMRTNLIVSLIFCCSFVFRRVCQNGAATGSLHVYRFFSSTQKTTYARKTTFNFNFILNRVDVGISRCFLIPVDSRWSSSVSIERSLWWWCLTTRKNDEDRRRKSRNWKYVGSVEVWSNKIKRRENPSFQHSTILWRDVWAFRLCIIYAFSVA